MSFIIELYCHKGRFLTLDKQSLKLPVLNLRLFLQYSLCLLLFTAPFLRGLYFESYFFPFIIAVAILFIIYMYELFKQRKFGFLNEPITWAMLAILFAYILSCITAVNVRAAVDGLIKYVAYFMVFYMCFWTCYKEKGRDILWWTFYLAGVGMAVFGLLVYCNIVNYPYVLTDRRISGTFEYANTFGGYLAVISIIGWSLILSNQRLFIRAALTGSNALIVMAMLGSLSRGTWILYPFAILVSIFLVGHGKRLQACSIWLASIIPGLVIGRWLITTTLTTSTPIYLLAGFILTLGFQLGLDYLGKYLSRCNISQYTLRLGFITAIILIIGISIFSYKSWNSYFTKGSLARLTNITLQDENVQMRFEFNRDAIKIIKDHPVTGIGSGGWEDLYHSYASHLYWSDKTHNYFLQTWVEAGTLGFLSLLAVWVFFVILLYKHWKKQNDENSKQDNTLFWGGAIAVLLLGAHSFIDFDMSYPAIAFLLFGLIGALHSQSFNTKDTGEIPVTKLSGKNHKKPVKKEFRSKELILAISAAIIGLVIILTATSFWVASFKFRSAQRMVNQDLNQALDLLDTSMQYDPLNASYANQAASFYTAIAVSSKNPTAYQQALNYSQKALDLQPYNIQILNNINRIYLQLGQYEQSIKLADKLTQVNPRDPSSYENLANTLLQVGLFTLDAGQIEKAHFYWNEALKVNERVPSDIDMPAIGLNYTSGQALLLLGKTEQGQQLLFTMLSASPVGPNGLIYQQRVDLVAQYCVQSRVWLSASLQTAGNTAKGDDFWEQLTIAQQQEMKDYYEQAKTWLKKANPSLS